MLIPDLAHRRRRWLSLAPLIIVASVGLLIALRGLRSMPVPAAFTLTPQPDQFSFVSTIKGSRVEFSLALFTGQRATPPLAFLSPLASSFTRAEAALAKSRWGISAAVKGPGSAPGP